MKHKILCYLITNYYQTTIFFDQMSTIQRYISEIYSAWIMYMKCSLKTKDGILIFVKYLKIFPIKISLSVPHHVSVRLKQSVIIAAQELLCWYYLVLFQNYKHQKSLKINRLQLCKWIFFNLTCI